MLRFISTICVLVLLVSCDMYHRVSGYVIDSETKKPLTSARVGVEADCLNNPELTDEAGLFVYRLAPLRRSHLFIRKEGYERIDTVFKHSSNFVIIELNRKGVNPDSIEKLSPRELFNQVVYGSKTFNTDSSTSISGVEYEKLIDTCIQLLKGTALPMITDDEHIKIMRCLNTMRYQRKFYGNESQLWQEAEKKGYFAFDLTIGGILCYPKYGTYFPKLKMAFYTSERLPFSEYTIVE